jgi:hypothetical protein
MMPLNMTALVRVAGVAMSLTTVSRAGFSTASNNP